MEVEEYGGCVSWVSGGEGEKMALYTPLPKPPGGFYLNPITLVQKQTCVSMPNPECPSAKVRRLLVTVQEIKTLY